MFLIKGRLNRLKFFIYSVCWYFGVCLVGVFLLAAVDDEITVHAILASIIQIGMLILSVRRLHDLNSSGIAALFGLFPLINIIFFLYLVFSKGTEGENEYGKQQ